MTEERSLLDLSLVGYIAAVLALFGLLLLRFRIALAATVPAAAALLPPLTLHSSFPLTDSWGLALEIVALGAAILALERGLGWLPLWIGQLHCSRSRATACGSRSSPSAGALCAAARAPG